MSDPVRRSLCEAVDGSILMGHMQELARWVKLSGTPDELQSLRYFQAKLDEYGYRTRLIMHDAYISLPGKARVDVDNQTLTSITHSFSRSSPPSGVTGRLVYVGDGDAGGFHRARPARCDRVDRGHRQPRPGARVPRAPARWVRCRSARTSICTRCASRRSGAARPARRSPNCPPPWCAPCRTPMAARCANAWRAASSRR